MRWKKYFWPLMFPVQIVLLQALSHFPDTVERYYSNGIFPYISSVSRILFDCLPFSAGDLAYIIIIGYFIFRIIRYGRSFRVKWRAHLRYVLSVLSVVYLIFNIMWGINYIRVPVQEKLGIEGEYSTEDLAAITEVLIARTNALHLKITGNDSLKVTIPHSKAQLFELSRDGYHNLSELHPEFRHDGRSVKKSLISLPLTYMGFSGYLNPFTNEAQVNALLPDYAFAATAAHEMAHQIGYASESEANLIGYLAATSNDDMYIQYSGYCLAVRYCLSEWEYRDEEKFSQFHRKINPGVLENFRESREFWKQHETFIERGFHLFYDTFLKLNQQEEGMESYSRYVDLLVNYHKKYPL